MTFGLAYIRVIYIDQGNKEDATLFDRPILNAYMVTAFFVIFNLLFLALAAWLTAKLHQQVTRPTRNVIRDTGRREKL